MKTQALSNSDKAEIREDMVMFVFALGVIRHAPGAAPSRHFWEVAAAFDRILNLAEARGFKGRRALLEAATARQSTKAAGALTATACAMLSMEEMAEELQLALSVVRKPAGHGEGRA